MLAVSLSLSRLLSTRTFTMESPPSNPGNPSRGKKLKEYVPDSIGSLVLPTILVMVLPLSVTLWLGHLAFSILRNDKHPDCEEF